MWCYHDDVIKWKHFPRYWPFCAGNSPVTGEFPAQRPVTRIFGVFFDLRLNNRLSKQWWGWWFETPSRPLWRHGNECLRNVGKSTNCWSMLVVSSFSHGDKTLSIGLGKHITVTSRDRHSVSNHQKLDCLSNSLFRVTLKQISRLRVVCPFVRGMYQGFPSQRASNVKTVHISWRHPGI